MALSPQLSNFLGGKTRAPRAEINKAIWKHIKDHKLQDPKNKRKIVLDTALGAVFENRKTVDMFTMNKILSKHIKKPEELVGGDYEDDDED